MLLFSRRPRQATADDPQVEVHGQVTPAASYIYIYIYTHIDIYILM